MVERASSVSTSAPFRRTVISSLSAAGLAEVRRLDPHLRIGFIVARSVGDITGLDVDFLSLHQKEVTPRLLRQAGVRGLPVFGLGVYNAYSG